MAKFQVVAILLILLGGFVQGCAILKVREQVAESMASTVLVGRVSCRIRPVGPIVVAAYAKQAGERRVAHYVFLHDCGEYELMVPAGSYTVFAFNDANKNMVYDQGELAGQYGESGQVQVTAGGIVPGLDIVLRPPGNPVDWPIGGAVSREKPGKYHSRLAGVEVSLDDERFQAERGVQGFWQPIDFYREIGGTIYFLEEYDPEKIPILFIHGAGDTPRSWSFLVESLDRERFQPWFFYYPSGARMRSMAYLLYWKLANLQVRYRFTSLFLTAHSMGGLVARSFLVDFGEEFPWVKLFVSMATPWGGDPMAEYGVKQSPGVIPCWLDMQPEGDFIQSLFRQEMPSGTPFYLFYGFKGNRNPFLVNNDGTIRLSSLLDRRAQAEARMSYAFNTDHGGMLASEEVVRQYNTLINSAFAREKAREETANGYLTVSFDSMTATGAAQPWPKLILKAAAGENMELGLVLRSQDSGKRVGPFPAGKYFAALSVEGFRTEGSWVEVDVEPERTESLAFTLVPDGMMTGYVTRAGNAENNVLGMPEWEERPQENSVPVQSITLRGEGEERLLLPAAEETFNYREMEVSRHDYCYNGYFRFFGLAAGMYTGRIRLWGGETIPFSQRVVPGTAQAARFFEIPAD